jgi:hypothetical protein
MFVRDDSFRVIHHPNLNEKTLIATTFLKKGSIFWFWGSFRKGTYETPSCNDYEMQCGEIIVDPQSYKEDSLLQYTNAPGPGELANLKATWKHVIHGDKAAILCRALCDIHPNNQITIDYGKEWFSSRNLKSQSVHLDEFPVRKRKTSVKNPLIEHKYKLRSNIKKRIYYDQKCRCAGVVNGTDC